MPELWNNLLVNPLFNLIFVFYRLTGSLGVSIIFLTLIIRAVLVPIMLPSLKALKKQQDLQPEIDKIKLKFKHDKKKQAEMQMELFKKHGINPASGCSTQIIMILVLIALYGVIRKFTLGASIDELNAHVYFNSLKLIEGESINTNFLYMDLAKPDPFFILAILAGLFQLISSKMTMPFVEQGEKAAKKTPGKSDDLAYNMQQQMLYTMPIMNVLIGLTLPSGVVLYMVVTTIFSIAQSYFVSGWGGLKPWIHKVRRILKPRTI